MVTGYLNSAAKGVGLARQPEHDTRYEIAEEYMQIVYQLWEGSWEDRAVLRDRTQRIRHDGRYFQIEAIHLCEPSLQRTPLIYQAGASSRGRQFAATHAECVFITSALEAFTIADLDRVWTVREIAKHAAIGGRGPVVVGLPEEVAEELIAWVDDTDVDGFNLAYAVMPETFADFVDLVVPELQKRGCYKQDYAPGTLPEKLYGQGRARLAQIIQRSGTAVLPICRAVDERVG